MRKGKLVIKIWKDIGVDAVHFQAMEELVENAVMKFLTENETWSTASIETKMKKKGREMFGDIADHVLKMVMPEELHHLLANTSGKDYDAKVMAAVKGKYKLMYVSNALWLENCVEKITTELWVFHMTWLFFEKNNDAYDCFRNW